MMIDRLAPLVPYLRKRNLFLAVIFLFGTQLSLNGYADAIFRQQDDRYELKAEKTHPNILFEKMEAVLHIPIGRLPENTPAVTVHTRSTDIEKILSSFCESYVILYGEDADDHIIMEEIEVTPSVDVIKLDLTYRRETVRQHHLSQKMELPKHLNFEYAGIGAFIQSGDDENSLWVRPLKAGTPAAKAGIKLGDKIIAIEGKSIREFKNLGAAVEAIRGPVNTPVQLLLLRPDGTRINQVVMREKVDVRQ